MPKIVTIIGRGHSATRLITNVLIKSNFFMGEKLNVSSDKQPHHLMWKLAELANSMVIRKNKTEWDFSPLFSHVPEQCKNLINIYLADILNHTGNYKGWKIPETVFIYPWLTQIYPDIYYIQWVRNPKSNRRHWSDKLLTNWNVLDPKDGTWENVSDIPSLNRALSWKYQYDIVKQTPRPKHFITIKMEDFIINQKQELERISKFLDVPLKKVKLKKGVKVEYEKEHPDFDFLVDPMKELGYIK